MLSNSLINAVLRTMSQPSHVPPSRKKHAKHPSSSCRTGSHKLKKVSSTATYVVDGVDEEQENVKIISSDASTIINTLDRDNPRIDKRNEKTTSSTTFGGRKLWNGYVKSPTMRAPDNGVIQEESEMIGVLTKQLYLAEAQMQKVRSILKKNEEEIRSRDQEIGKLKRKVKDWETKNKNHEIQRKKEQQQRKYQVDHSEYLYKRCLMLEHKIFEMEKFLADYGLVWVGDTNGSKNHETTSNNYIETCYEQIIANIDQLNLAAGKGEVHVHRNENGSGATFKTPSCMSLKFYRNGMIVQDGPFRHYNDPTIVSFLRDILDGYFPSELQQAYPNGVPFKVEDHRTQTYLGDSAGFPGQGYRLGKQPPVDNPPLSTSTRKASNTSQRSGRRSSLPKDTVSTTDFSGIQSALTTRSLKPKSPSEAPSMEMYILRSQILASHNNICSDTHLQSHINAELGLSSRKEKKDVTPKNGESDLSMRERILKSRGSLRVPSAGRCYHSSTDRSSSRPSPSRLDSADRNRQRSRSASVSSARLTAHSRSMSKGKIPFDIGSIDPPRISNPFLTCNTFKSNSSFKSTTSPRKPTPPVLHQINEPSGNAGELRLKVRSLNGGTAYLVHVSADESVARLYQLLDRAMSRSVPRGYKIVLSGYSPRRLEQLGVSLRESGITRDCVLHLIND